MINTVIYSKPHDNGTGGTYIVSSSNRTRVSNSIDDKGNEIRVDGLNVNGIGEFIYLNAQEGYISKLSGNVLDYDVGTIRTFKSDQINSKKVISEQADIKQALIDQLTSTNITTEYLTVTKQAHFFELIIDKIKSVGGQIILTPANCVVDFAKAYDSNGNETTNENASFFRVYWRANDPVSGKEIANDWEPKDQALCQSFNNVQAGVSRDVSNRYYWRLVKNVSTQKVWCDVNQQKVGGTEGNTAYDDRIDYGFGIIKNGTLSMINDDLDVDMNQTLIGTDEDITLKVEEIRSNHNRCPFRVYTGHKCSAVGLQVSANCKRVLAEKAVADGATAAEAAKIGDSAKSEIQASTFVILINKNNLGLTTLDVAKNINVAVIFEDDSYMIFPNGTGTFNNNAGSSFASMQYDISAAECAISKIIVYRNEHSEFVPCHWIDLGNTYIAKSSQEPNVAASNSERDYALVNNAPEAGDNLVQLGYRYDGLTSTLDENGYPTDTWSVKRASAIILSAYNSPDKDIEAPSYAQYQFIRDFNLSKYRGTYFDANGGEIGGDVTIGQTVYERIIEEISQSIDPHDSWRLYVTNNNVLTASNDDGFADLSSLDVAVLKYTRGSNDTENIEDWQHTSRGVIYDTRVYGYDNRQFYFVVSFASDSETISQDTNGYISSQENFVIPCWYSYDELLNDPNGLAYGTPNDPTMTIWETGSHQLYADNYKKLTYWEGYGNGWDSTRIATRIKQMIKVKKYEWDHLNTPKSIKSITISLRQRIVPTGTNPANKEWQCWWYYPVNHFNSLADAQQAGLAFKTYWPYQLQWGDIHNLTTPEDYIVDFTTIKITNLQDIGFEIGSSTSTIVIYKTGETVTDISGDGYKGSVPTGWEYYPTAYNPLLNEHLWMSTCTVSKYGGNNSDVWTNWSVPVHIDGEGNKIISLYRAWSDSSSGSPAKPTISSRNEYEQQATWHEDASLATTTGRYTVWMSQGYETPGGAWSNFTNPIRITGANGNDGEDGTDIEFIFKLMPTNDSPATPQTSQTSNYVPEGWTDHPSGVRNSMMYEFLCVRTSTGHDANRVWGNWSSPVLWSVWGQKGSDGDGMEYIYTITDDDLTVPTNPTPDTWNDPDMTYQNTNEYYMWTGGWRMNMSTGELEVDPSYNGQVWYDEPQDISAGHPICWVSVRKRTNGVWGQFSDPAIWARWTAKGMDGLGHAFAYCKQLNTNTPTKPSSGTTSNGLQSPWTTTMPTLSLLERAQDIVIWMTQCIINGNGTYGTWTDPLILSGQDGKNGEDGIKQEFIYCRVGPEQVTTTYDSQNNISTLTLTSTLNPNTINTSTDNKTRNDDDFVPTGWTDNPSGISQTYPYEFVAQRFKSRNNSNQMVWSDFSTPQIWAKWGVNGMDGDGIEYIFTHTQSGNPTPNNWQDNNGAYQQDHYVPTGWYDNMQGVSEENNFEYVCMRKKVDNVWQRFSDPKVWAQWTEIGMSGESFKQFYCIGTVDNVNGELRINLPSGAFNITQGYATTQNSLDWTPAGWSSDYPNLFSSSEKMIAIESGESYERIIMTQCIVKPHHDATYTFCNFTTPMLISGSQGLPGEDGTEIEFLYARSTKYSYVPTFTNGSHSAMQVADWGVGRTTGFITTQGDLTWSDNPRGISADYPVEWMVQRYYSRNDWGNFTSPVVWSKWGVDGRDGDGVEYIFLRGKTSTVPDIIEDSYTAGVETWNKSMNGYLPKYTDTSYYQGVVKGNNNVWSDGPQGVNETWKYEFVSIRRRKNNAWQSFEAPQVWARYALDGGAEYKLMPINESGEVNSDGNVIVKANYHILKVMNNEVTELSSADYFGSNVNGKTEYTVIGSIYDMSNNLIGIIPSTVWKTQLETGTYGGPDIVSAWIDSSNGETGVVLQWPTSAATRFGDYWTVASNISTQSTLPSRVVFALYKVISPSDYSFDSIKTHRSTLDETGLEKIDQRIINIVAKSDVIWRKTNDRIEQRITDRTNDIVANGFSHTTYYNTLTNTAQQMSQVLGRITNLESTDGTIQANITTINEHISTAESDISTLQERERWFTQETGRLQTEINSSNSLIRTAQSTISRLQQTVDNFNTVTGNLSTQISNTNERIDTAQSSIQTIESKFTQYNGSLNTLSSQLTNTNQSVNTALSSIRTLTTRVDTVMGSYVTKSELKQTSDSITALVSGIDTSGFATKSELTQTANSLSSTITNVDNKFGSYATKSQLTQTANSLTSTIDSKINGAKSEIKQTTDSISLQVQAAQNTANNAGETASNIGRNIQYGIQLNGSTGITLISDKVKFQSTSSDKLWLKGTDANGTTIFELGTSGGQGKRSQLLLRDTNLSTSSYGLLRVDLLQLVSGNRNIYLQFDSSLGPILRLVNGSYSAKFYVNSSGVYVQYQNQSAKKIS